MQGNASVRRWAVVAASVLALGFAWPLLVRPEPFYGGGVDSAAYDFPLEAFATKFLQRGELPLWNPFHLGGVPFQTGFHGFLGPSLWTAWVFPPQVDLKLGFALHLILGAAGAAWMAGRRTRNVAPAVLAGVAFALGGFFASQLFAGHRRQLMTAAYLPWIAGLLDGALRLQRGKGLLAGAACGLMILCCHYQIVYIGLIGLGVFFLLDRCCAGGSGQVLPVLRALATMALVGVALSSVQLLPALEASSFSQRSRSDPAFAASFASAPANLLSFLWPQLYGNWVEAPFFGSWAYMESVGYLGLVPLALIAAAPALLPWRRWLPAAAVCAMGVVLSLGASTPFFDAWLAIVPGSGLFRAPGRYLLLPALFGPLLAAEALDAWLERSDRRPRLPLCLAVIAAAVALWIGARSPEEWQRAGIWLGGGGEAAARMNPAHWRASLALAVDDTRRSALILGACALLLWAGARLGRRNWAAAALVALSAVDLYGFGGRFLIFGRAEDFRWPPELERFLGPRVTPGLRMLADPRFRTPGLGAGLGISQVGGYDTFLDRGYTRYVLQATSRDPESFATLLEIDRNSPMVHRLGAEILVSTEPRGFDGWANEGRHGNVWVFRDPRPEPRAFLVHRSEAAVEQRIWDRLSDPGFALTDAMLVEGPLPAGFSMSEPAAGAAESVHIVSYEPDAVELAVAADAAGAVVLSDTWHPGWQAVVDGQRVPVIRANLVMRAVPVPAGQHRVRLVFAPRSFQVGAVLSGTALAAVIGGALWLRRSRSFRS